ncbi:hypothetical protein KAJ83_11505 [Marivibrio halodurans]|uniref:Uncharacterized protein n=1 Tax=Marivibrio halodurans TaxID=2039722 RepID=A0A8J7V2X7_9PROT|nr:hypothetical protein [Marivibrio halodurans]MBP5857636.1 hypothetical protein [Marivibrio halodurans]
MASEIGASGASQILSAAQQKPGSFKIKTGGAVDIRRTLDQLGADANRQRIFQSALTRLRGIAQGVIQPEQEWETIGGFLQSTGQPFTLEIDEKGQIKAAAQSESDLQGKTARQQAAIREAITQMQDLVKQSDFEDTKANMRAELAFGILRIEEMKNYSPPEEYWERRFQSLAEAGRPVKLALDGEGNKVVIDQLEHNFSDVENGEDRLKLMRARDELRSILRGDSIATQAWHFSAIGNASSGDDYFLDLDEAGNVTVQRNTIDTVTPEFLAADEDGPETTAPWQEEALALYNAGKGFHFDALADGTITVVENTLQSMTRDDEIEAGRQRIQSALVSLLA